MTSKLFSTLFFLILLSGCVRGGENNTPPNLTPLVWSMSVGTTTFCGGISGDFLTELTFDRSQKKPPTRFTIVNLDTKSVVWKQPDSFGNGDVLLCKGIPTNGSVWGSFLLTIGTVVFTSNGISDVLPPHNGFAIPPFTSPVMIGNTLIVGNNNDIPDLDQNTGFLYAYDLDSPNAPKLLWQRGLQGFIMSMASGDSTFYVGYRNTIEAINPITGMTIWKASTIMDRPLFSYLPSSIQVREDKLFAMVFDHFQAFDRISGKRLWVSKESMADHCPGGGQEDWPILVEEGRIFVGSKGGRCVYAINTNDGSLVWAQNVTIGASFGQKPILVRGVLYATNGYLWGFDAITGKVLSVTKEMDSFAYDHVNLYYYPPRDEIIVWSDGIKAYKPIK